MSNVNREPIERKACTVQRFARQYDVHPTTVFRWIKNGELRAMRIGGRVLVLLDSLPPALEPKRTGTHAG